MNKIASIVLISFGFATLAHAQPVAVSNDPAKIAAIERHAQELRAQQPMGSEMAMKHDAMHDGKMHHHHHRRHHGQHHHGAAKIAPKN